MGLRRGKGDPQDCKKNRSIRLLSMVGKTYNKVLTNKVVESISVEDQVRSSEVSGSIAYAQI